MNYIFKINTITFIVLILISCRSEDLFQPISDISIQRIDQDIWDISNQNQLLNFLEKNKNLSDLYFKKILGFDSLTIKELNYFREDSTITLLDAKINLVYSNTTLINQQLSRAFENFVSIFPDFEIPVVYSLNTGLNYQTILFENDASKSSVVVSLDMFLGDQFPYVSLARTNPTFSKYLSKSFNKEHVTKKIIDACLTEFYIYDEGVTLLDQMIMHGKQLFIMENILAGIVSDTVIIEFNKDQLEWCQNNEKEIWAFFIENDLFYSDDFKKINKYINPAPHAPGMPPQAPGRVGNYIGWQIIKSFMKNNKSITIPELLKIKDSQLIFKKSKFKPK